jgi:hypothetical protein
LRFLGRAMIAGTEISHVTVPADDLMQAFAYRHLVPANALQVAPHARTLGAPGARVISPVPVKLLAGGTTRIQIGSAGRFLDRLQFELDDPPEGVSLKQVLTNRLGLELVLSCAATNKAPREGNFIINLVPVQGSGPGVKGKQPLNQRRGPVGRMPAVPFELVTE